MEKANVVLQIAHDNTQNSPILNAKTFLHLKQISEP